MNEYIVLDFSGSYLQTVQSFEEEGLKSPVWRQPLQTLRSFQQEGLKSLVLETGTNRMKF